MLNFIKKSFRFGSSIVNQILEERKSRGQGSENLSTSAKAEDKTGVEKIRENARKIWDKAQQENLNNDLKRRETSMLASQGKSDHSGSAYHGPGNVDHEKVNSNMSQRNFNNHDSNRLG